MLSNTNSGIMRDDIGKNKHHQIKHAEQISTKTNTIRSNMQNKYQQKQTPSDQTYRTNINKNKHHQIKHAEQISTKTNTIRSNMQNKYQQKQHRLNVVTA